MLEGGQGQCGQEVGVGPWAGGLDSPIQGECGDLRWDCRFRDVWGRVLLSLKNVCACVCMYMCDIVNYAGGKAAGHLSITGNP